MDSSPHAIELSGITKRFPGVVANRDISMTVARASIHAVVGENGAGKSTLMKILYGMQGPDEGTITVNGSQRSFGSPAEAIEAGIGMVHQHFMLSDNFTVLENIILGGEPTRGMGRLDLATARRRITEVCEDYGIELPLDTRVEIVKVLYRGARILILDEPTAVLVPQEVKDLFRHLKVLVEHGLTILFVSHKLDEVLSVADAITVIRRGTTVQTLTPAETDARGLARLMVGSDLPEASASAIPPREELALRARGVTVGEPGAKPVVDRVDLDIHAGQIVGLAGIEGNGQVELIDALMGLVDLQAGTIEIAEKDLTAASTRDRRAEGLAYIPYDRHREGLLLDAPLWENRMLGNQHLPPLGGKVWISARAAKEATEKTVAEFDVRTPNIFVNASALSGGNQQKLIVGRELASNPKVLIAAHPTRGVDVGAQGAIWASLRAARDEGMAILLVSSDLDELIGLSDQLAVIHEGRITSLLDPSEVTPESLGLAMTGAHTEAAQ